MNHSSYSSSSLLSRSIPRISPNSRLAQFPRRPHRDSSRDATHPKMRDRTSWETDDPVRSIGRTQRQIRQIMSTLIPGRDPFAVKICRSPRGDSRTAWSSFAVPEAIALLAWITWN